MHTYTTPFSRNVQSFCLLLAMVALWLPSQLAARADVNTAVPHSLILIVPHAGKTPRMDASADDPAWHDAAIVPSLQMMQNSDYPGPAFPTEVRLLWDKQNLYLRFTCGGETEIYAPYTGHDQNHWEGDVAEVFVDPVGDAREWFEIEVTPTNQTLDKLYLLTADAHSNEYGMLDGDVLARNYWNTLSWDLQGLKTAAQVSLPTPSAAQATPAVQPVDGTAVAATPAPAPTPQQPVAVASSAGSAPLTWTVDIALPASSVLHRLGLKEYDSGMTIRAHLCRYAWPKSSDPVGKRTFVPMTWSPVIAGCPHLSPQAMGYLRLAK